MEDTFESPLASSEGRNYAVASSVAPAIMTCIRELIPTAVMCLINMPTRWLNAKMLMLAQRGKLDGFLLEGMACPGGCIGGAGTLAPLKQSTRAVQNLLQNPSIRRLWRIRWLIQAKSSQRITATNSDVCGLSNCVVH